MVAPVPFRWQLSDQPEPEKVRQLAHRLSGPEDFPELLAGLLVQRGIYDTQSARTFLSPSWDDLHDPALMKDMPLAVDCLLEAIERGDRIFLFGDYDVDGTTAIALMRQFFQSWGIPNDWYVPDRFEEGYGLSYKGVDAAVEAGAKVLVTLDCGIKAVEQVRYARQPDRDLSVIICDHHTVGEAMPEAQAILNPQQPDCQYPSKVLSGCGVAFKLLQALDSRLRARYPGRGSKVPTPPHWLDLVALSIACDLVPITDENRTLASLGLEKIRKDPLPGIAALMDLGDENRSWQVSDLVFFIGPIINAAGRMGHAREAVRLLAGEVDDLKEAAGALYSTNEDRKRLDRQMAGEAIADHAAEPGWESKHGAVLFRESWHHGLLGIAASRVVDHFNRPAILLSRVNEHLTGSARSVPGFDMYQALEACSEHLLRFGGHRQAAGLTLRQADLPAFKKSFEDYCQKNLRDMDKRPVLKIDTLLELDELSEDLPAQIDRLGPFGPGNSRPVFGAKDVGVLQKRVLKEAHLKLALEKDRQQFEAIGFFMADRVQIDDQSHVHLAFQPEINTWQGKSRLQLKLKDIKSAHETIFE